jgi:protein-S-isoprenylcysteine O-methyltransferase Ste14
MSAETPAGKTYSQQDIRQGIIKRIIQLVIMVLIQAIILFIAAGRLDWIEGWAYIGLYLVLLLIASAILLSKDPGLVAERARMGGGGNAKGWDRIMTTLYAIASYSILLVGGLDARFGWSPRPMLFVQLIGAILFTIGYGLVIWAMMSNSYFSSFVRIQDDRGHKVASGGPYAIIRHPGYVGMSLSALGTPLLLGSWWALIPALLLLCLVVVRTSLEDRTLQKELDGYTAYANKVKYRLIPGIW